MSIWQIIRRLVPFVKPYRRWVVISLLLTLAGAFAAQVNPIVTMRVFSVAKTPVHSATSLGNRPAAPKV